MTGFLPLIGCENPCFDKPGGRPLDAGEYWRDVVDRHAAAAFDDGECHEEPPHAVVREECEYLSDPTLIAPSWISFDRERKQDYDGLVSHFTAVFGAEPVKPEYATHCRTEYPEVADRFGWLASMSRSDDDLDMPWPGANRFSNGALVRAPPWDVDLYDRASSYSWLCLEAVPPVEGLVTASAEWRGVLFVHSETEKDGFTDYLLSFSNATCVSAECEGGGDGIDNDYDGVVDEGPDVDGECRG